IRANTTEGLEVWAEDLRAFGRAHPGQNVQFNETTILPLKPGTILPGSGECFKCGKQGHGRDIQCPEPNSIPDIERLYRMFIQRELGQFRRVRAVNLVARVEDDSDWIFAGMAMPGKGEGSVE
ncbi:hypothetical protein EV360DRAFT_54303, partial [Lentinula raphanica]